MAARVFFLTAFARRSDWYQMPALAGSRADRIRWMEQGGEVGCAAEALPAADTAEAEQGQRSAFCEGSTTPEAKTGHRNPEQCSNFHKGAPPPAGKIG